MTGTVGTALPDPLVELWRFETQDSIEGSPAIVGDTAYVASMDQHLYALDLATGKEKWKYKAGPFKAAPSVQGDAIYVGDSDGVFHCVDAKTGTKRWTLTTEAEITSGANFAGDKVLFGSYDENLYCLTRDGKVAWKFACQGPVNGSPVVAGDRTFVAGCDSILHILDINSGKELNTVDLGGQAAATAAVAGDGLYVGTMNNQVLGIDWKKPEVLWTFEAQKRPQAFYASAAVAEGLVITASRDKRVYALDRKTGKEQWSFPTEGRVDASPVVAGERVYAGSLDGKLYVLDLKRGTEVQKIDLGGQVTGSPAVGGGRLVVGNVKGVVYCFGAKK
jgi:outer membrane protein assembly factor BamB